MSLWIGVIKLFFHLNKNTPLSNCWLNNVWIETDKEYLQESNKILGMQFIAEHKFKSTELMLWKISPTDSLIIAK